MIILGKVQNLVNSSQSAYANGGKTLHRSLASILFGAKLIEHDSKHSRVLISRRKTKTGQNQMLDNICSLPLTSDIFAQAIHPKLPILCVGLSSGHVETYRLPALDQHHDKTFALRPNARVDSNGRRLSENGFDMVDSVWRTRRHKGSCRSLAYSLDGEGIFSTGTEGLVKLAETGTGRVTAKIVVPHSAAPSILSPLSPQALLLGTDDATVHVYDLRSPNSTPSTKPNNSFRPHDIAGEVSDEPINSLTPLPPTAASTSGTCRSWISTSGSTLSVIDLRKGVVTVSEDQDDLLMSSACIPAPASKRQDFKGGVNNSADVPDRVVIGGMSGSLTIWDRGNWIDRSSSIPLGNKNPTIRDSQEVEQVTVVPAHVRLGKSTAGPNVVVAGLSNGILKFVKVLPKGGHQMGQVTHNDQSVDGIATLGFDVAGRMISGGGQLVKIWHEKTSSPDSEVDEAEPIKDSVDSDDATGDEKLASGDSDSNDERHTTRKRKKRKRNQMSKTHGNHGIMAFQDMN